MSITNERLKEIAGLEKQMEEKTTEIEEKIIYVEERGR